jgi:enterochelin esterase-like enzyme
LGVTDFADASIASGEAVPFMIVMPYVADWSQPDDYPFGQALVEEVLPYIESGFRAAPLRSARAVGGISRGGSWALHLGTRYWDMFGAFGGHSAPVFLEDADTILSWLDTIPAEQAPRIYIDLASSDQSDIQYSANWFVSLLERLDLAYQFHVYSGYHDETYWSAHVEEYLRFYIAEWKP